jgi:hypothetical protein
MFGEKWRRKRKQSSEVAADEGIKIVLENIIKERDERLGDVGDRIVKELIKRGLIQQEGANFSAYDCVTNKEPRPNLQYEIHLDDSRGVGEGLWEERTDKKRVRLSIRMTYVLPNGVKISTLRSEARSNLFLRSEMIGDFIRTYQINDIVATVYEEDKPAVINFNIKVRTDDVEHYRRGEQAEIDAHFDKLIMALEAIYQEIVSGNVRGIFAELGIPRENRGQFK